MSDARYQQKVKEYLNKTSKRLKENASNRYSIGGLVTEVGGLACAEYWQNEVYPEGLSQAHRDGKVHIHDQNILASYCAGWNLQQLLLEGFQTTVVARPPKHLRTAVDQLAGFLCSVSQEMAGAQAVSDVDVLFAPFVREDGLGYAEVRDCMESLVYAVNLPTRWGSVTPFTNLNLTGVVSEHWAPQPAVWGGEYQEYTYGDLREETALIARAFLDVLLEGQPNGAPWTFPIVSINVSDDTDWGSEFMQQAVAISARWGTVNYINVGSTSPYNADDALASCCRLSTDLSRVREKTRMSGGLFDIAPNTGAIGVVTINLAYLGYEHQGDEAGLYEDLVATANLALGGLRNKRAFLTEALEAGLYPHVASQVDSWDTYYSVISVCGANEMVRNYTGDEYDISDPRGKELVLDLIRTLRSITDAEEDLTGIEMAPCEGASGRMARHLLAKHPDAIVAGEGDTVYLTNGTQLHAAADVTPWEIGEHQGDFHPLYNSGVAQHLYMSTADDAPSSQKVIAALIKRLFSHFSLTHLTWNPSYSVCDSCGRIPGHHTSCPTCGSPATAYERVLGYWRPMAGFNPGKQGEFKDRKYL